MKCQTIKTAHRSSSQSKQDPGIDQKNGSQQRQKHHLESIQNTGQTSPGVLCSDVDSIYMQKDKYLLESVEKSNKNDQRFQNIDIAYEERLEKGGLTKLAKKRRRGDLIETHKMMTNKEVIPFLRFSSWPTEVDYDDTLQNLQEIGRRH